MIQQDQIEGLAADQFQRFVAVTGFGDGVTQKRQMNRQHAANVGVVVGNQD